MGIFTNHVLRNLFCGMSNDKLQECYRSRRTSLIAGETIGIWKDMIDAYKEFMDYSEHPKAAEALCEAHMNEEIAH